MRTLFYRRWFSISSALEVLAVFSVEERGKAKTVLRLCLDHLEEQKKKYMVATYTLADFIIIQLDFPSHFQKT